MAKGFARVYHWMENIRLCRPGEKMFLSLLVHEVKYTQNKEIAGRVVFFLGERKKKLDDTSFFLRHEVSESSYFSASARPPIASAEVLGVPVVDRKLLFGDQGHCFVEER